MLTQNRLKELFSYDPKTGLFRRLQTTGGQIRGTIAGVIHHTGYRHIRVNGRKYQASHLAWLYIYGRLPAYQIDHRNLDYDDDRVCNLREATHSQNMANKRVYKNNACGVKGIHLFWSRGRPTGKWRAQIKKDGKVIHLGLFRNADDAAAAYQQAASLFHGEFSCTAPPAM